MNWDSISTLSDLAASKSYFLAHPGCDIDHEAIENFLAVEDSNNGLAERWFDLLVERFSNGSDLTLYRHMTVPDVAEFADSLRYGASPGDHWSTSEATWSPSPDQSDHDVRLTGVISTADVDWLSTFRCLFSHPWEQEVAFSGEIRIHALDDLETGAKYEIEQDNLGPKK